MLLDLSIIISKRSRDSTTDSLLYYININFISMQITPTNIRVAVLKLQSAKVTWDASLSPQVT